ncbi:MAG: universal stress protein [Betaproteobacteria bacterium]
MFRSILAPIDGSSTSLRGLDEAIELAKQMHAQVRALFVVDEYAISSYLATYIDLNEILKTVDEDGRRVLQDAKERADRKGVPLQTVLEHSGFAPVADIILEQARAWPADLVVMGTHGRRGFRRLIMGSDAQTVVQSTPVPVLLIRAPEDANQPPRI